MDTVHWTADRPTWARTFVLGQTNLSAPCPKGSIAQFAGWSARVCESAARNSGSSRRRRRRRKRRKRRRRRGRWRRRRRRRRSTGHIPHSGAAASPWWPGGARPCISVCTTWQGGPGLGRPAGCPKFYLAGPRPPLSPAGSNHRHAATALQHSDQQLVTSNRLTDHLFQITACLVRMAEKEAVGRP